MRSWPWHPLCRFASRFWRISARGLNCSRHSGVLRPRARRTMRASPPPSPASRPAAAGVAIRRMRKTGAEKVPFCATERDREPYRRGPTPPTAWPAPYDAPPRRRSSPASRPAAAGALIGRCARVPGSRCWRRDRALRRAMVVASRTEMPGMAGAIGRGVIAGNSRPYARCRLASICRAL